MIQELSDRRRQRDAVEAYFKAHPWQIVTQDELRKAGSGDAARSRVSECVTKLGMDIESIRTRYIGTDGKKHRGFQQYRYRPTEEAPPDPPIADTYVEQSLPGIL